jgi:hypothetical protein
MTETSSQKYYRKNKDKLLKTVNETETPSQKYYRINGDRLRKMANETVFCDTCQINITKSHISSHKKSKKHIVNLGESIDDETRKSICKYNDENVVKCECGAHIKKSYIDKHYLTEKHILNMRMNNILMKEQSYKS